jgi:hypothetical protein
MSWSLGISLVIFVVIILFLMRKGQKNSAKFKESMRQQDEILKAVAAKTNEQYRQRTGRDSTDIINLFPEVSSKPKASRPVDINTRPAPTPVDMDESSGPVYPRADEPPPSPRTNPEIPSSKKKDEPK